MRYFLSRANLVGLAAAVVAGAVALTGVFGVWWPAVVAGAYALGALVAPREAASGMAGEEARTEREVRLSLNEVVAQARGRTDHEVAEGISRIRRLTLMAIDMAPDLTSHLPTIRQIALEYLPRTVENYLAIPARHRLMRRDAAGRTARDELLEQLALLEGKLREIVADVGASEVRDLAEHGVFLETRFSDPLTW